MPKFVKNESITDFKDLADHLLDLIKDQTKDEKISTLMAYLHAQYNQGIRDFKKI